MNKKILFGIIILSILILNGCGYTEEEKECSISRLKEAVALCNHHNLTYERHMNYAYYTSSDEVYCSTEWNEIITFQAKFKCKVN